MHSLFLSHSSQDNPRALQIKHRLEESGYDSIFLDFDENQGIKPGADWEKTLYVNLLACDAVIALITPASIASRWCLVEIAFARALNKPLIPLADGIQHPHLAAIQHVALQPDLEAGLARLFGRLVEASLAPDDSFDVDPSRPPYPGLVAFEERDAGVFFGRSNEIKTLLASLRARAARPETRALAVIGPSGSGKSSLVRAGLLPRLQRDPSWLLLPSLRPGDAPVRELTLSFAGAFKRLGQPPPPTLKERLAQDPQELLQDLLIAAPGEAHHLVLFADQFEEVFTRAVEPARQEFFARLAKLMGPGSPLLLLLTLRSETLSEALRDPFCARLLSQPEVAGPLEPARLAEVIEGPARRAGLRIEPGLAGRMAAETGGGDALPLLAYTLNQLQPLARNGEISATSYDLLGGVRGALERQADQALQALEIRRGPAARQQALEVLARLAALDVSDQLARRPLDLSEVSPQDREILNEFIERRLLVTRREGDDRRVVEAAHEALLRQWPPLHEKLATSLEALRWWQGLERAAAEWQAANRNSAYLWPGSRLAAGWRFLDEDPARLRSKELLKDFVAASQQYNQQQAARQADALASAILEGLAEDPERAIRLSLEGARLYGLTPRLRLALWRGLQENRLLQRFIPETRFTTAALSLDGTHVALAEADHPLPLSPYQTPRKERPRQDWPRVMIYSAQNGAKLAELRPHDSPVEYLRFSPDSALVFTRQADKSECIWSVEQGACLHVLSDPSGQAQNNTPEGLPSPEGRLKSAWEEKWLADYQGGLRLDRYDNARKASFDYVDVEATNQNGRLSVKGSWDPDGEGKMEQQFELPGHGGALIFSQVNDAHDRLLTVDSSEARFWRIPIPFSPADQFADGSSGWLLEGSYVSLILAPGAEEAWLFPDLSVGKPGNWPRALAAYSFQSGESRPILNIKIQSSYSFSADHRWLLALDRDIINQRSQQREEWLGVNELPKGIRTRNIPLGKLANGSRAFALSDDGETLARCGTYWLDIGPLSDLAARTELPQSRLPGEGELDTYVAESLRFCVGGSLLAAATVGGRLKVWDVQRSAILYDGPGGKNLAFSADQSCLLTWGSSNPALIHLPMGQISRFGSAAGSLHAAIAANGSLVATSEKSAGVVYDAHSGEQIQDLPLPTPRSDVPISAYQIVDLCFFPDGQRIAGLLASTNQTMLILWEIPAEETLLARAEALPLRELTPEERRRYGLT